MKNKIYLLKFFFLNISIEVAPLQFHEWPLEACCKGESTPIYSHVKTLHPVATRSSALSHGTDRVSGTDRVVTHPATKNLHSIYSTVALRGQLHCKMTQNIMEVFLGTQ